MDNRVPSILFLLCWLPAVLFCPPVKVWAQAPLYLANDSTAIKKISFQFRGERTFEEELLRQEIVLKEPGFRDRLNALLPFRKSTPQLLNPLELQRDVVRLRNFYQLNGFLQPDIQYADSRLDTTDNTIHVVFQIREGPPLIIQDFGFYGQAGDYLANELTGNTRRDWINFRDRISLRAGDRYTEIEQIRIYDQVLSWLQQNGFAFAKIQQNVEIDSTFYTVDLGFNVDTGPLGYIAEIEIEGNEQVSDQVVIRELPYKIGDLYDSRKIRKGQQELFGLNLFRVALSDIPTEQQRDSTVAVRIRLREAKPRYITAETGYSRTEGITLRGDWLNRNFFGDARNLRISVQANTGLLGTSGVFDEENTIGKLPARSIQTTFSLRQPYIFTTNFTALVSPFAVYENNPQLPASELFFDINQGEFGLNSTLIYEAFDYRPISIGYSISRAQRWTALDPGDLEGRSDFYNKSILDLSATLGWTNNYLDPRKGYLIRPFIETAGRLFASGTQYNKVGLEAVAYLPLTRRQNLSTRFFIGRLWTYGKSRRALEGRDLISNALSPDQVSEVARDSLIYRYRFDDVFFYSGGGNDVRGWSFQLLGPKIARADTLIRDGEVVLDENGEPTVDYVYERLGGLAKLSGNIELRYRLPGLSSKWRGAAFLDFGQITDRVYALSDLRYAAGAGLRYQTIFGFIRVDLAYKLNPQRPEDLARPREVFLYQQGLSDIPPQERFSRRFGLHISIGQAF